MEREFSIDCLHFHSWNLGIIGILNLEIKLCFFFCLVCEECQDLHYGDCPVHGPLQAIADKTVEGNPNLSAAVASLPPVLKISQSSIPGAGLGVFSASEIPKGVRFGPYKGKKIGWEHISDETNTSYMWEVAFFFYDTIMMSKVMIITICKRPKLS